jgi:ASC-1-like (ASCH) protein
MFTSKLKSPYYEAVRDGIKIYEVRCYDEARKKMNVDDNWNFNHNDDSNLPIIKTKIVEIKLYPNFRSAIEETGYKSLLPEALSIEEAISIYESFDNGNYKKNGELFGVVRFKLEIYS